jgi:hypothetical protein
MPVMPLNTPSSAARSSPEPKPFRIGCEAGDGNRFQVQTDSVSVTVGQRVLRGGILEMWDSVSVHAKQDIEGVLVVEVLVFNPDWDEPVRIASISSRPQDETCLTALGCCFDHVVS